MQTDDFWTLIQDSKAASGGTFEGHAEALASRLFTLPAAEVADFQRIYDECMDRTYTWDLWGAAYVLGDGCSDDGFIDFRSWLISMGREAFEKALGDPDSLAEIELGPDGEEDVFFEEFAYVAADVYEEKTGDEMPRAESSFPDQPTGEPWEEEGDELSRRFPRLWSKYASG